MLKKLLLYSLIYIVVSLLLSHDEVLCAFKGEELCWVNLIGKFIIFMILILAFDQFVKPKIFKR